MDESEILIFNPTRQEFTHTYDVSGKGEPIPFTIQSYEVKKFPKTIAEHLALHLKNKIVGEMSGVITQTVVNKVYKQIYMEDELARISA